MSVVGKANIRNFKEDKTESDGTTFTFTVNVANTANYYSCNLGLYLEINWIVESRQK
jgi:hypothetical protein